MKIDLNKIYNEDCLETLKKMSDGFVNCCITSPPYYGLRDYGVEGQIGLEETPEQYVEKLVAIFREVRRVLKDDGTLWLNLGDTYYNYRGANDFSTKQTIAKHEGHVMYSPSGKRNSVLPNLKGKDLIGIPWMVAFALRADGWYLRQDIIWHKPNPMPESVTDRCTKAHEYIFLLSKSQRYYYDVDVIKEKCNWNGKSGAKNYDWENDGRKHNTNQKPIEKRNKRSVWTVNTQSYKKAHFATFPEKLIVPCIKAGCPDGGVVYDPFMGAGTTALVAHKLNRKFIGSELNPEYVKIAERRLEPYLLQQKLF